MSGWPLFEKGWIHSVIQQGSSYALRNSGVENIQPPDRFKMSTAPPSASLPVGSSEHNPCLMTSEPQKVSCKQAFSNWTAEFLCAKMLVSAELGWKLCNQRLFLWDILFSLFPACPEVSQESLPLPTSIVVYDFCFCSLLKLGRYAWKLKKRYGGRGDRKCPPPICIDSCKSHHTVPSMLQVTLWVTFEHFVPTKKQKSTDNRYFWSWHQGTERVLWFCWRKSTVAIKKQLLFLQWFNWHHPALKQGQLNTLSCFRFPDESNGWVKRLLNSPILSTGSASGMKKTLCGSAGSWAWPFLHVQQSGGLLE